MAKQLLIDVLMVITIPIFVIGGYFLWFRGDDTALLSAPPILGANPLIESAGAKTKQALDTLSGIALDGSLFADPAYIALEQFNVVYPTSTPLSRKYPFTPSPIIEERLRQAHLGYGTASAPKTTSDPVLTAKINQLKKSLSK